MTRKRPVFVKDESSSEDDFNGVITENDYEKENVNKPLRTKPPKGKKATVKIDEKQVARESDFELFDEYRFCSFENESIEDESKAVYELDKYWPYKLKCDEPEDKNLLYLASVGPKEIFTPCDDCKQSGKTNWELTQICEYSQGTFKESARLSEHPESLLKFLASVPKSESECSATVTHLVKCCDKALTLDSFKYGFCSNLIKLFVQDDNFIHVYLKVDDYSLNLIPKYFTKSMFDWVKERIMNEITGKSDKNFPRTRFSGTFDFPEARIPGGFSLNLRDYQLRSISWMMEVESPKSNEYNTVVNNFHVKDEECFMKAKLGRTPYYVALGGKENVSTSPRIEVNEPLRLHGGILADNTGSGKTVTMLALIHSSPFNEEKRVMRTRLHASNFYGSEHVPSGASLILCPSNIYRQWLSEAKRCNPNFRIVGLSTILDHNKVSWKDVITADIVIVSYQFLLNSNYKNIPKSHSGFICRDYSTKGLVKLHHIHFHRIILDEIHELESAHVALRNHVKSFRSDNVWGLTGTPKNSQLWCDLEFFNASSRLTTVCKENTTAYFELKYKFIKRNLPNLALPPIENETVWVEMSSHELALFNLRGGELQSTREQIMKCCHYQLNESQAISVDSFLSIDQVQRKLCNSKKEEVLAFEARVMRQKEMISARLAADPDFNTNQIESELKGMEKALLTAESSYNYVKSVFQIIDEPDKNECRICYDTIPAASLSILPCSHLYCYDCVKAPVERSQQCPLCRHKTLPKEIYRIRIKDPERVPEALVNLDTSKYSSKLIALYRYITDLIAKDPEARIILFLQYSDLADFMAQSFKELQVNCVRVVGNVFQRQNAIAKFRDSKEIRLIMMSSEDSVSGINLTQATHVILLHPFWTNNGEETDLAYEKQGISRAYRFGLDHPLKVVRFAVRGTVEEEITLRRQAIY